jgi:hypothetical protein
MNMRAGPPELRIGITTPRPSASRWLPRSWIGLPAGALGLRVCHPVRVPCVTSVESLLRAAAGFVVADVDLAAESAAAAAAQQSLDDSGLLLLGEMRGARENPLLARALMRAFGITRLALEWDEDLAPVIEAFLATGTLADHWLLWSGDGRITAGHLAVLAELATARSLEVILFDGAIGAEWDWSDRDKAMAGRLLAAPALARTLVVAGNAHTPTRLTQLGIPMGAWLHRQRPGVREIRINYGSGRYYNTQPCRFTHPGLPPRRIQLHQEHGLLVLDLPTAAEAIVPHRSEGWPPPAPTTP